MSVAVAQMPRSLTEQQSMATKEFSEDLLEALLASCQKSSVKAISGPGRDLIPYFANDRASAQRGKARRNSSPPRVNPKATAAAAAMIAAAKNPGSRARASGTPPAKASSGVERAVEVQANQLNALVASWAGPGFCVSPTPEKLPMPTSSLLG